MGTCTNRDIERKCYCVPNHDSCFTTCGITEIPIALELTPEQYTIFRNRLIRNSNVRYRRCSNTKN